MSDPIVGVLSFSEDLALSGEVATAAAEVARMLGTDRSAMELEGTRGPLGDADSTAAAIVEVMKTRRCRALLVGETRFGTIVAAKVAARLGIGSLGKGKGLRVEGGRLVASRDVYGGKFTATVACKMPCVAVVQQGAYQGAQVDAEKIERVRADAGATPRVSILETRSAQASTGDVKSAPIVVAAGRGFAHKEDLALAQALADALGAALGCSRPLSSDLGWMGEQQHIGLTGAYVHPHLYIAVGISGQLQHVAGIKDSKVIVAINKDRQAPIFQAADYGIVGDLYEVLPALTKMLTKG